MEKKFFATLPEAWAARGINDFIAVLPDGSESVVYEWSKCAFCGQVYVPSVEEPFACSWCGAS